MKLFKISLNTQILIGALLGICFGVLVGHTRLFLPYNAAILSSFNILGSIFINCLKIIMIPLVFTSIAAGIANLRNTPNSGRIWPTLILYSITTTSLAAITGLITMNYVKPGINLKLDLFKESISHFQTHSFSLNDFGNHLLQGFLHPISGLAQYNILTVVLCAILTGVLIINLNQKIPMILLILNRALKVIMDLLGWIMHLAPLGILALLTKLIAQANIPLLLTLSKYIFVVVGTTLFHGLITLPAILWLVTRISPWQFAKAMKEAFITAFSTSSSTATLPVSMRCMTDNLKIDQTIARFVLPIGATLNMDGTAMYEAMAALFVANLCHIHLTLFAQITVTLTAMMASIGAPGIPSAGMVTMIMVLQSVGLPAGAVAILIAIDRPLDTIRTVVNVEGDCIGACVVQKLAFQRIFSRRM